jgi:hypothetical protein
MRDNSNRLPTLAAEINTEREGLNAVAKTALGHAICIGEKLIEAKALLDHGAWLPWLSEHCHLSERQAQKYMRIARAKEALEAKAPLTADFTIEGAIEALVTAKPPNFLPPAGFIRVGESRSSIIVVAPSHQNSGFFYVTHITNNSDDTGEMIGGRRPIRHDLIEVMLAAMDAAFTAYDWRDVPSAPWAYNSLLFDSPSTYLNSLRPCDDEDRAEMVALASSSEPVDFGVHLKRGVVGLAS